MSFFPKNLNVNPVLFLAFVATISLYSRNENEMKVRDKATLSIANLSLYSRVYYSRLWISNSERFHWN